jgi:hypothetical protein
MDRGLPGMLAAVRRVGRGTDPERAVGAAAVGVVGLRVVSSWPEPNSTVLLLLLVGIPAWVMALFTIALWYRALRRRRRAETGSPASDELPSGEEG